MLALFKPTGEPVMTLDAKIKATLRKLTLSGKYQVLTRSTHNSTRLENINNSFNNSDSQV